MILERSFRVTLKNKIKNIILILVYILFGIVALFVPNREFGAFSVVICACLVYTRIDIIYALKPVGTIHARGSKYWFQKKGLLELYKKIKQIEEIILVVLALVLFILGIFL